MYLNEKGDNKDNRSLRVLFFIKIICLHNKTLRKIETISAVITVIADT